MFKTFALFTAVATLALAAPMESQQKRSQTFTGQSTFYDVSDPAQNHGHTGEVACYKEAETSGIPLTSDSMFVALGVDQFEGSCGKTIVITDTSTQKTTTAVVLDKCMGCPFGNVDMTPAVWKELHGENMDDGVFPIEWHFE